MSKLIKVKKKNGAVQRSDVTLTKETSIALVQKILVEGRVVSREARRKGYIELTREDGSIQKIACNTLNTWVSRNNVVPDTGTTLREILDNAREEYRNIQKREMDKRREDQLDRKFNRIISMKTKEPAMGMFGVITDKKTGKPLMLENTKLLAEQMKNVRFLAERLVPNRYGKVEKAEHKHMFFSLSDLRKYEEEKRSKTE